MSLLTLLEALGGRIHRVLAAPGGSFRQEAVRRGAAEQVIHLPPRPQNRILKRLWLPVAAVWLAIRAHRLRTTISLIHANATNGARVAALASRVWRTPVAVWVHDQSVSRLDRRTSWFYRMVLFQPRWLAVSNIASSVPVTLGFAEAESVGYLPNPVSTERVVREGQKRDGQIVVGFLGSASPRKGFDVTVATIEQLRGSGVQWRLFTARTENRWNRPFWDSLAREDPNYVQIVGTVKDVSLAYAQCDIIFVPSRNESFGLVVAEAMANSLPIVASDIPAFREVAGETACLFEQGDARAAASAILSLVEDPDKRERLGREGRSRVRRFAPEIIADRMVEEYLSMVP